MRDKAQDAPQQQQVSQQLALTLVTNARCTAAGPGAAAYVTLSLRTERGGVSGHLGARRGKRAGAEQCIRQECGANSRANLACTAGPRTLVPQRMICMLQPLASIRGVPHR